MEDYDVNWLLSDPRNALDINGLSSVARTLIIQVRELTMEVNRLKKEADK